MMNQFDLVARRTLRFSCIALAILLSCATSLIAQESTFKADPKLLDAIKPRMQQAVDANATAGIVTLVTQHGKVVESSAVGLQDRELGLPMREDSIFQLMSMTKPFTAVAMMILVDEGKVSLNDEVQKYLPEFKDQKVDDKGVFRAPSHPIKIYELLSHSSGMHYQSQGSMKDIDYKLDHTLAEAVSEYATQPLDNDPGTTVSYSNMGVATAGRIIEVISGKPYQEFIKTHILDPLQMKDTFFIPPADKTHRVAIVYSHDKDGKLIPGPAATTQGGDPKLFRKGAKYAGPELALFSTAQDLSHFYQMMLDGGTWNGVRILSPVAAATMTTPITTRELPPGRGTDYGVGWNIVSNPLGTLSLLPVGSYGHAGAFHTMGMIVPKYDLVEIYLTACDGADCGDATTTRDAFEQLVGASLSK